MSRIDRETTNELNALNAHIRVRDEYETTDDEYEDIRQYRDDATPQRYYIEHTDTAPKDRNEPLLHDKYRDDATENIPRTDDCWPPIGECQSCGFQPQQRAGNRCIALARICSFCGIIGHMERTCKKTPELNPTQTAIHTNTDNSTSEIIETNPSDDQPRHANPGEEMHLHQDTTYNEQSNNEDRYDTEPTGSENHKPQRKQHSHTTKQNEIQSVTISEKNGMTTSENASNNENNSKRDPTPRSKPETENQRNPDHNNIRAYLWTRLSETIDALKSNSTHELSATELSLAERIGIGDDGNTTAPTREKHFRNTYHHKKQTVS